MINWRSTYAIYRNELVRFMRTVFGSLISPVLTTSLYFIVFGAAIGGRMNAVGGVDFYDRTDVASGLVTVVGDAKLRETIRGRTGPETPVFKLGKRVAAWGCEQHNCGDHNWTVIVDPTHGKTQVCYHDAATMGAKSDWYDGAAPARRSETCPSEG